jgi:peptidyl-prolyl cis-trans isomerase C
MGYHHVKVFLTVLLALCLFSGSVYGADSDVLARIGNKNVTQKDLDRLISCYPEKQQALIRNNAESLDALLERLVTIMVVSDIAKKQNFDKKIDAKKMIELLRNEYLTRTYIEEELIAKIKVNDKEIAEFYAKNKAVFDRPEQVHARHILIAVTPDATEDGKKAAKQKAAETLDRIKKGEDFAKLAGELSDDSGSKQNGGDLGFFPRNRMIPEFEEAAFALEPGTVSGLVETSYGIHIIKVEEKKKAETPPFEEVKETAKAEALEAARRERVGGFIQKSFKEAGVQFPKKSSVEKK